MMNVGKAFDLTADRYPEKVAIVDGDTRLTYEAWNDRIDRFANALLDDGVTPGDRLGICMRNRVEFLTTFYAAQKSGSTPVPIPVGVPPGRLRFFIDNTDLAGLVYDSSTVDSIEAVAGTVGCDLFVRTDDVSTTDPSMSAMIEAGSSSSPSVSVDESDAYCIWHTSGSTGEPKAIRLTQEVGVHRATRQALNIGYSPTDIALPLAPFYHLIGSEGQALPIFMLGGTVVLLREFDPDRALELFERESVTVTAGVPTQYNQMLQSDPGSYDLSSLRALHYAGEPMTREVTRACIEQFDAGLYQVWGTTEILDGTCLRPEDAEAKIGSCGLPTYASEVRLVKPRAADDPPGDPDATVQRGEPGEIIISSELKRVADEYWGNPEATRRAFKDGWFFTGDVGQQDEDGYFYIVDRIDNMILSGGEKIYPREIEEVLQAHPGVREVAVTGVTDEQWGERVKAVVVADGVSADDLDAFCLESDDLVRWKRPKEYAFVEELPRNPSGKVDRSQL